MENILHFVEEFGVQNGLLEIGVLRSLLRYHLLASWQQIFFSNIALHQHPLQAQIDANHSRGPFISRKSGNDRILLSHGLCVLSFCRKRPLAIGEVEIIAQVLKGGVGN
jgi:hypothetical protein